MTPIEILRITEGQDFPDLLGVEWAELRPANDFAGHVTQQIGPLRTEDYDREFDRYVAITQPFLRAWAAENDVNVETIRVAMRPSAFVWEQWISGMKN